MVRGKHSCEWCDEMATYRVKVTYREYERFSCNDDRHKNKTETLVQMDQASNKDYFVKRSQKNDGFLVASPHEGEV